MIIETCPKCGHDLVDICQTIYPPKYGKLCFKCGWKSDPEQEEMIRIPYKGSSKEKLAEELSEYFGIPCNLCNKYFEKDGSCPRDIDWCNSKEHWELLIERIKNDERNK